MNHITEILEKLDKTLDTLEKNGGAFIHPEDRLKIKDFIKESYLSLAEKVRGMNIDPFIGNEDENMGFIACKARVLELLKDS